MSDADQRPLLMVTVERYTYPVFYSWVRSPPTNAEWTDVLPSAVDFEVNAIY